MRRLWIFGLVLLGSVVVLASAAAPDGPFQFTPINFPGATSTSVQGINPGGDIVGIYAAAGKQHGFLLSGGNYTSIDFPGAIATDARGISPGGDIVGSYTNSPGGPANIHGYLLSLGNFSTVTFPGHLGSILQRIGPDGDVYGCYHDTDLTGTMHGFVRTSAGDFNGITVQASMHNGATPSGNTVVGLYTDLGTGLVHGYIIDNGNFAQLDVPGSNLTAAWDINPAGDAVGAFRDLAGKFHGFLRDASGTFTSIDFPAAIATRAFGINPGGDIVGAYVDSGGKTHGFLRSRPQ